MNIFSWVASMLVEGFSPGSLVLENLVEGLTKYNESISRTAEAMQRSWNESICTLKIALGENYLLSPKSRKQIAKKFTKEIIIPFAIKNGHTGRKLKHFCKNVLQQCQNLEKISKDVLNFSEYSEKELLNHLISEPSSSEEISLIIISNIQKQLPEAKELVEILEFRNLLMEGLVAHFHVEISCNPNLAAIIDRLDRENIQKTLSDIKREIHSSVEKKDYAKISLLGAKATRLSVVNEVCILSEEYQNLLGPVMQKLDRLAQDHDDMNEKLDTILKILAKTHDNKFLLRYPNFKLVNNFSDLVDGATWDALPEEYRLQIINTLMVEGQISQVICILQKLIDAKTKDGYVYFAYFKILRKSNEYVKAVKMYNIATSLNKSFQLFPSSKYKMLAIIAKGRTGFVYQALDLINDQTIAIKVLKSEYCSPEKREQLWELLVSAQNLQHENIVKIHEFSNKNDTNLWIAMEYLNGISLQKKITIEKKSFQNVVCMAIIAAKAIDYAHKQGMIHGDLKPINFVETKASIKIVDFGLAEWKNEVLLSHEFYSSIYYFSPEKLANSSQDITIYDDIYSFGKTLYYLFTGDEPYDMEWESVPVKVREIIKKATRKLPNKRYSSIKHMLQDLQEIYNNGNSCAEDSFVKITTFNKECIAETKMPSIKLIRINLINDISHCP